MPRFITLAVLALGFAWGGPVLAAGGDRSHEPIRPLTAAVGLDPRQVALGRELFLDPILSRDGTIRCASCHSLSQGGADTRPHSLGVGDKEGSVNAPTVYNTTLNVAQFWDGRAATLEEQAGGPITNPVEMAADWPGVVARLRASPYRAKFRAIFAAEPDESSVRAVLASFERSLISTGSRFDRWLLGNDDAITQDEKTGYVLFKSYGCASCHQGANVGGNMFQKFGFFGNWFDDRGHGSAADLGRYNVTKQESDRYVFKVPSLRMVVLTAPYFHDGSVGDLSEAIGLMGRYQLGREISGHDTALIAKFLATLPGKLVEDAR
ncbi:MAG TPA: cytochrome c peroxidase [Patescibacteria group bacterium]|nr:cytochrome c peroxidase [Patescibacteria group bacterium]